MKQAKTNKELQLYIDWCKKNNLKPNQGKNVITYYKKYYLKNDKQ